MKSVYEYILLEAKFMGFSKQELEELNAIKTEVIDKNKKYLDDFSYDKKRNLVKSGGKPIYGNKYLIYFESNPLANDHKFSKTSEKETGIKATPLERDEDFYMLGIADKFGRIFLYGRWDEDPNPPFIQYKESEVKTSKAGKKYRVPSGWKLTKKDQEYYKVEYWNDVETEGLRYATHAWNPTNYKQRGIYDYDLNKHIKMIFDLNDIPAKVQEILDAIEQRAKEEAIRKEEEKKREEQRKKNKEFWDEVNTYKNLGMANCWTNDNYPKILSEIDKDPEAEWIEVTLGRCYHKYICKKYKVYYTCDSSD